MARVKYISLMLAVFVLALGSCSKKSSNPPMPAQSISLMFNGTSYTSSDPFASYVASSGQLQIECNFGTAASIFLVIPSNTTVGTFPVASNASQGAIATFSNANMQDNYIGSTGSIVITTFTSTTVAGTFQFTGTDQSNSTTGTVTSGKFQANY